MKNIIKGGEKKFSPKLYLKNVIKGGVKQLETTSVCDCDYFTLFHPVSLCFTLFGIEFVANRALWVALNLSRITHFSRKFLGPKKSACVKVLTYSTSENYQKIYNRDHLDEF